MCKEDLSELIDPDDDLLLDGETNWDEYYNPGEYEDDRQVRDAEDE